MEILSISEKLAICQNCKNRKFNSSVGIICGLTESKPTFEEICSNYSADEVAIARQSEINNRLDEREKQEEFEQSLSGGGLYGIGGLIGNWAQRSYIGAICFGLIFCTLGWYGIGMHHYVGLAVSIVYLSLLLLIGIMAIVSYKKQKDNTVPLGTTFWIMMMVIAAFQVISQLLLTGHLYALWYVIVNLLCSGVMVWHLYFSSDIKEKFPYASRKWHILEKVVLIITVALFIILLVLPLI